MKHILMPRILHIIIIEFCSEYLCWYTLVYDATPETQTQKTERTYNAVTKWCVWTFAVGNVFSDGHRQGLQEYTSAQGGRLKLEAF